MIKYSILTGCVLMGLSNFTSVVFLLMPSLSATLRSAWYFISLSGSIGGVLLSLGLFLYFLRNHTSGKPEQAN
jgi:hypothetical protein